jgi:hypothetical protein
VLPVCKYGSGVLAKSMHVPLKPKLSGSVRFSNTFELLNDLLVTPECDLGSEVAPAEDVSLVERGLGV